VRVGKTSAQSAAWHWTSHVGGLKQAKSAEGKKHFL